jgi:pimeloyl-ACP methyl ester carboxylesterase
MQGAMLAFLITLALLALSVTGMFIWLSLWSRLLRRTYPFDSVETVVTSDGARIVLGHVAPRGEASPLPPVVLCHGLAMNRHAFALDPTRSLAARLAGEGRDVWVLELRGAVAETRNAATRFSTFDSYVEVDIPEAIDFVCKSTGASEVDWIGFSMGGMLAYAYLGAGRGARVRRLVTIGSPVRFADHPHGRRLVPPRPLVALAGRLHYTPFRALALVVAPLMLRRVPYRVTRAVRPWNFSTPMLRAVMANSFGDVPTGVTMQFIRWINEGTFNSNDGRRDYDAGLADIRAPMLVIVGSRDRLAPPAVARHAFERSGSAEKEFLEVGRATGAGREYDHLDLVLGEHAPDEVFPRVVDWLARA